MSAEDVNNFEAVLAGVPSDNNAAKDECCIYALETQL